MNGNSLRTGDVVHVTFDDERVNLHREYDASVDRLYVNSEDTKMIVLFCPDCEVKFKHVSADSPYMSYTFYRA